MNTTEPDDFDRISKDLSERVAKAATNLREFCDSVVILATINEAGSSDMAFAEQGNHHAAMGSMERYLRKQKNLERFRDEKSEAGKEDL